LESQIPLPFITFTLFWFSLFLCFRVAYIGLKSLTNGQNPGTQLTTIVGYMKVESPQLVVIGCLHDRANIEQIARRSMVISMLIRMAGGL